MNKLRALWLLLFLAPIAGCSPSFSDADIEAMKKAIRQEFEKRDGVMVVEVVMLKESATKATGFVKLTVPILGDITKACSATMAENSQYIWRCE